MSAGTADQDGDPVGVVVSVAPAGITRREERREINWIALIRLPDGSEIPTTVKDISPSGARLAIPSSYTLPNRFLFKVVERDFVCVVEMVWRDGDHVGVRIDRVGKTTSVHVKKTIQAEAPVALRARPSRFSQI